MPIRVLGDDGGGATDDVARGVDYARTHGANVINLSLGSEVPLIGATGGDAFDAAVHRAIAAGIVVVAAAGNNGVPVCEQPAAGDGLLCVGAVDKRRQRSFFSSFGSGLGLVAPGGSGGSATGMPGEDVLSTFKGSAYEALAGTSQAAPHVSGRRRAAGRARRARAGGGASGSAPPRPTSGRRAPTRSTAPGSSTRAPRWRGWAAAAAPPGGAPAGAAPRHWRLRARQAPAAARGACCGAGSGCASARPHAGRARVRRDDARPADRARVASACARSARRRSWRG